jgi:hypothetical protein
MMEQLLKMDEVFTEETGNMSGRHLWPLELWGDNSCWRKIDDVECGIDKFTICFQNDTFDGPGS